MRAYVYGWGATGPGANNCQDPPPTPTILQETVLSICSSMEGLVLVDSQLCAVGSSSNTYFVIINHHSPTEDRKGHLII